MVERPNCWEVKRCGRQPGGPHVGALGACPASTATTLDGINHGRNAGRCCWAVAGTLCGGQVQGTFAMKLGSCLRCEFYKQVVREEGRELATARTIQDRLKEPG